MNREDEFMNVLKDCWVGREYSHPSHTLVVSILYDRDNKVIYNLGSCDSTLRLKDENIQNTCSRKSLEAFLNTGGYRRLK